MSTSAILMMLVAMIVLWGGLALAVVNVIRTDRAEPDRVERDL
jgi:hypothetical protein